MMMMSLMELLARNTKQSAPTLRSESGGCVVDGAALEGSPIIQKSHGQDPLWAARLVTPTLVLV